MSIPVSLEDLPATIAKCGFAYLLTVTKEGGTWIRSTHVRAADGVLTLYDGGRRTRDNVVARPAITLLWPPAEPDGWTLLVDGTASVGAEVITVEPSHAVLHRSPPTPAPD
ncbi:MAG: pyridoxamine 5'-phosphate oxidase [Sporichthyaceae bacterium]